VYVYGNYLEENVEIQVEGNYMKVLLSIEPAATTFDSKILRTSRNDGAERIDR